MRRVSRVRRIGMVLLLGSVLLPAVGWAVLRFVPLPAGLDRLPAPSLLLTDRDGDPLRELPVDGHYARPAAPPERIPLVLKQATLAAEDKRFYAHGGVDFLACARALRSQLGWRRAGERRSGGSTISQQFIKLTQPRPRTLVSKLLEAAQARRLEQVWSKERILAAYLNRVDYGNLNLGCVGAARYYFNKPLADLSAAEAAFLAALPQSPTRLNPHRHFALAKRRQEWVLARMAAEGWLSEDARRRAVAEPLRLQSRARAFEAPHFVDMLLARQGRETLEKTGGASGEVRTSLDLELNRFIAERLRSHLMDLRAARVGNGAAVVIDNRSGDIVGLVGSVNYRAARGGQINGAWAPRSPGSTMKPFTYLLALERGATAADTVADLPAEFPTRTGIYRPENYNQHCYGPMRLRPALGNSLNISAVKVLADLAGGPAALQRRLRQCGLTTLRQPADHYGLGLTLGNAEARLLELTNAYACLARLGAYRPWRQLGAADIAAGDAGDPACDPHAAYLIADMLSDNAARALAFGLDSNLRWDFPVACKTGTSTDFRDNWAIGYTPEFTVGVWVGNFDGSPMVGVSGVSGAGPLLHDVFERLHARRGTSWYAMPPGIVERAVHRVTGHLLEEGSNAPDAIPEKFLVEHLPKPESPADYDAQGRALLGAEYADWLKSGDNSLAGRATTTAPDGSAASVGNAGAAFAVAAPLPGSTYLLNPDLPASSRWLDLRVKGCAQPRWECSTLDCQNVDGQTAAHLREGRHTLRVQDPASGQWRETWIVVKAL